MTGQAPQVRKRGADGHQVEMDRLFEALLAGRPYNEVDYSASSTMTAILGRMASYSGQLVTWEEAINSQLDLSPSAWPGMRKRPCGRVRTASTPLPVPWLGQSLLNQPSAAKPDASGGKVRSKSARQGDRLRRATYEQRSRATSTALAASGRVAVGTDLVGVLLRDRCAANHDLRDAEPGRLDRGDRRLHGRHGGGQQRRQADDLGVVVRIGLDELLRRDVGAQVDHVEVGPLPHHGHQVLADVVQVALHGADDRCGHRRDAGRDQQRLQQTPWPPSSRGRRSAFRERRSRSSGIAVRRRPWRRP